MIEAFGDRILVKPEEVKDITEGGIYLTDSSKDRPNRGVVINTGFKADSILPGAKVIYGKYAGVEIDGYILIREEDILATDGYAELSG